MYKTFVNNGIFSILTGEFTGFLPSTVLCHFLLGAMTLSYPLLLAMCRLASASSGCACANGWMMVVDMGVSKNNGIPKSSILIGFSIISHPFWGTPIFGNTHMLKRWRESLVESCVVSWVVFFGQMMYINEMPFRCFMLILVFHLSFECFRCYIHAFLMGPSPRFQKKRTVGACFSPHPLGHEKKKQWPHSENQDLSETTIGNYKTKGPAKALKKNDKNQAIEIPNDGIWKKWKKIITPHAFFHLLSSRKKAQITFVSILEWKDSKCAVYARSLGWILRILGIQTTGPQINN